MHQRLRVKDAATGQDGPFDVDNPIIFRNPLDQVNRDLLSYLLNFLIIEFKMQPAVYACAPPFAPTDAPEDLIHRKKFPFETAEMPNS
jgi:hypothetical protein